MKSTIPLAFMFVAAACMPTTPVAVKPVPLSSSQISNIKSLISYDLKDPSSASFREISGYKLADGNLVVCGQVNGKNSFGGFVGFKQFYLRFLGDTVVRSYIDGPSDYELASISCKSARSGEMLIPTSDLK